MEMRVININENIEHVDTVEGDQNTHVVHVTCVLHYCATMEEHEGPMTL